MTSFDHCLKLFTQELNLEIEKLRRREPRYLYEPVIYTLNMGGKRIRPVLVLLAYSLYSDECCKAIPAAVAIEMFHNFTLLHDDIMDNATLRRNNKTVHVHYSTNAAILSGDAMSILSYEYITRIESPNYREIMLLYTQTALEICEGQQYDMEFESRDLVSEEEYLRMIGLKTAVLLAASLKIGALLADAPADDAQSLYDFGYNLGMAFQLQDDYLDSFGDQATFGKNIGGDILSNKKTFLAVKAFETAVAEQLDKLRFWYSATDFNPDEKIRAVQDLFRLLNIHQSTRLKMEYFYGEALRHLNKIELPSERKQELLILARRLMNREH